MTAVNPTFLRCRFSDTGSGGNLMAVSGHMHMALCRIEDATGQWLDVSALTSVYFDNVAHNPFSAGSSWLYGASVGISVLSAEVPNTPGAGTVYYGLSGGPYYTFDHPVPANNVVLDDGSRVAAELTKGAWTTPTLLNSWSALAGFQNLQYRKVGLEEVQIRGAVENGTGSVIFTLPAGHRPSAKLRYNLSVYDNGGPAVPVGNSVTIDTNGDVSVEEPAVLSSHKVSFGTITFSTT